MLLAVIGPFVAPYDPLLTNAKLTLAPPSLAHPFGADALGRDILSRVIIATRLDLGIAVGGGRRVVCLRDRARRRRGLRRRLGRCDHRSGAGHDHGVSPSSSWRLGIVAALGNSVFNIILATAIINLPFYARFARAEVNVRRGLAYVEAARMGGNRPARILATQIVPNILPAMAVQGSLNLGWAILNAAGLSFIGLGVRPPTPEWGIMVSEGASYIFSGEWWTFTFPGLALVFAVFCFNLIGDGLRDLIDPRGRT